MNAKIQKTLMWTLFALVIFLSRQNVVAQVYDLKQIKGVNDVTNAMIAAKALWPDHLHDYAFFVRELLATLTNITDMADNISAHRKILTDIMATQVPSNRLDSARLLHRKSDLILACIDSCEIYNDSDSLIGLAKMLGDIRTLIAPEYLAQHESDYLNQQKFIVKEPIKLADVPRMLAEYQKDRQKLNWQLELRRNDKILTYTLLNNIQKSFLGTDKSERELLIKKIAVLANLNGEEVAKLIEKPTAIFD